MPNATTGYKNKNPADGPANTPIPPRPPEKLVNLRLIVKDYDTECPIFLPNIIPLKIYQYFVIR